MPVRAKVYLVKRGFAVVQIFAIPPSKGEDLGGRFFGRGGFKRAQKAEGAWGFNLAGERAGSTHLRSAAPRQAMHTANQWECALHLVKAQHMEHGGKPYFSPRVPPFRPCVIERPAARNAALYD